MVTDECGVVGGSRGAEVGPQGRQAARVKGAKDEAEADRGGFGRPGQTSGQERGMIQALL